MMRSRHAAAALLTALALAGLTGCDSGDEPAARQNGIQSRADARDQQLKFVQCLRKQGLSVADPTPGGRGLELRGDETKIQAAMKACRQYDPKGDVDPNDPAVIDRVLKNQQCLRRHGIDAPDPQPGQPPQILDDNEEKVEQARDACREELRRTKSNNDKDPK
ncbi:hypothetical protein [Actinomadura sp. HBU206391]|uniref:hypothetical protein n=1 Tax=Actinomadura sp. HBU206391 TaxID=2731692 RepID=UPI001650B281|nr:hypothetical protein [Actinomadura sp. HBU206391]MBC6458617.1 hypothetical protein [Actinomadura sp. HBU206391]